jgi:glycosyltransferase involved in cell wall biosynthesis
MLFVAFKFPPEAGSSGYLRSLKFCRYLPECGWLPIVLSAHPRAYERVDAAGMKQIPANVEVKRLFALDAQQHLAIRGRYPRWIALPDRWVSWVPAVVVAGIRAIFKRKIDVIFTTYPIASAVFAGLLIERLTGKPWVVDLRDSMTDDGYPSDPATRRAFQWLERQAVKRSALLIFTAPSALRMYRARYSDLAAEKCVLISNGYDEQDFETLKPGPSSPPIDRPARIIHSGVLYPEERDPKPFFRAIGRLKAKGTLDASLVRIELRASGWESDYSRILREQRIEDIVALVPPLPYKEALQDAMNADALLLFQAANCDHQIPAKAYEYLRYGKPILALTTENGDTGALLREAGGTTLVDLADEEQIVAALPTFLEAVRKGQHPLPDEFVATGYSRKEQARQLAKCLNTLTNAEGPRLQRSPSD